MNSFPSIGENDVVYSYKVKHFTNLAPCFQDGVFSLACCKGNIKNGGMRVSICKQYKEQQKKGNDVWIIGIAGTGMDDKSDINFQPREAIFLAKVSSIMNWADYSLNYQKKRLDAIYTLENGKVTWHNNGRGDHNEEENRLRDCTLKYQDWDQERIFRELDQIVISREYYIFNRHEICEELNVGRSYTYKKNEPLRVKTLKEFVQENNDFLLINDDPFK